MRKLVWVASSVALMAVGGCVVDPTYTYCNDGNDCEPAEQCFIVMTTATEGAFCSEECSADFQCERNLGFPGSCMNADDLGGICFQECDINSDCFSSSECFDYTDTTGIVNRVCLPNTL